MLLELRNPAMRVGDVFGTAGALHHPQKSSPQLLETLKMVTRQHEKSLFFVQKFAKKG